MPNPGTLNRPPERSAMRSLTELQAATEELRARLAWVRDYL
jgi:hypothetical protein